MRTRIYVDARWTRRVTVNIQLHILRVENLQFQPIFRAYDLKQGLTWPYWIKASGPEHYCERITRINIYSARDEIIHTIEFQCIACQ